MRDSISKKLEQRRGEPKALISNLNNNDPDFDELRADVQKLLNPPPIPAKARPGRSLHEFWLRVIVKKMIGMKFNEGRVVFRSPRPPADGGNVLRLGDEWFIVGDYPGIRGHRRERKRQTVYWLLDQALRSGEFSQVRRCGSCPRYFATTRSDRLSCSPECNVKRQNANRQSSDGRLDKYTTARWEHREDMFKKAQRMEKQGRTFSDIKEETGLTQRVFRREQSGLGLVARLEFAREKGLVTPD
jgi:hypothetical protein